MSSIHLEQTRGVHLPRPVMVDEYLKQKVIDSYFEPMAHHITICMKRKHTGEEVLKEFVTYFNPARRYVMRKSLVDDGTGASVDYLAEIFKLLGVRPVSNLKMSDDEWNKMCDLLGVPTSGSVEMSGT